jgi:hypothetical protein
VGEDAPPPPPLRSTIFREGALGTSNSISCITVNHRRNLFVALVISSQCIYNNKITTVDVDML